MNKINFDGFDSFKMVSIKNKNLLTHNWSYGIALSGNDKINRFHRNEFYRARSKPQELASP